MYYPTAVAPDGAGGLYTVELYSNSVRRIFSNGTIVGIVGNNCQNFSNYGFAGDGNAATNALLNRPQGVSSDGFGGVLVAGVSMCRLSCTLLSDIPYPCQVKCQTRETTWSAVPLQMGHSSSRLLARR